MPLFLAYTHTRARTHTRIHTHTHKRTHASFSLSPCRSRHEATYSLERGVFVLTRSACVMGARWSPPLWYRISMPIQRAEQRGGEAAAAAVAASTITTTTSGRSKVVEGATKEISTLPFSPCTRRVVLALLRRRGRRRRGANIIVSTRGFASSSSSFSTTTSPSSSFFSSSSCSSSFPRCSARDCCSSAKQ